MAALWAPAGQTQGATTKSGPLRPVEEEQHSGWPAAAHYPEGRAGTRRRAALLVVDSLTRLISSSRLALRRVRLRRGSREVPKRSLRRRIGRNTLAKVLGEVASRAGGLVFYFLLARWVGPDAFGRYSFAFSYSMLFTVLVDLGTNVILTREIARRPGDLAAWAPRTNGLKLASTGLFLAVLAATLPLSARARDTAGLILALGALTAGTIVLESLHAILSGLERMELEALSRAFNKVCVLAGAAIGFAASHSLGGAVTGLLIGTAVSLCGTVLLLGRLGAPLAARWDPAWNRALLAQSLPLVVSWIFWNLYDNQDVVVLAYMGLRSSSVGHFAAAMKLIDALRGAPVLIAGAVFPILSVGARDDVSRFARVATFLLRAALSAALPVAVAVWALAPSLVRWIYGAGFAPAAGVLQVAGWAVIGIFLNHALINLLVALDLQRWTIAGAAGAALANLAALLVLTPAFGLPGAAAALVVSEAVFLAINVAVLNRHAPGLLGPLALRALQPLVAGGVMAAFLTSVAAAWHPIAAGAAGLGLYLIALAALGGMRFPRERTA